VSEFDAGCRRCPRLNHYLDNLKTESPDYHNAPVGSFGDANPKLLIVGLAPGLHGANKTGRPFSGDASGHLLYQTLIEPGLASAPATNQPHTS